MDTSESALRKIVGILYDQDDQTADSLSHVVNIVNPDPNSGSKYVPIVINGDQWNMLWWIFRLSDEFDDFYFFLNDYITNAYSKYINKNQ